MARPPGAAGSDRVHLHAVIADTLEQLRDAIEARHIRVENRVDASLPALHVDKPKFYRLFELLLKDEMAGLPAGSTVTISAGLFPGLAPGQQEIQVQLSDNGPGLSKEDLRLVFDPFAVDRSGSLKEYGIHLMACFFIVHHHSGRIDARSEPGQGTTFTLRLPTNPAQVPPAAEEQDFLQKVLLSEALWEKLISSD